MGFGDTPPARGSGEGGGHGQAPSLGHCCTRSRALTAGAGPTCSGHRALGRQGSGSGGVSSSDPSCLPSILGGRGVHGALAVARTPLRPWGAPAWLSPGEGNWPELPTLAMGLGACEWPGPTPRRSRDRQPPSTLAWDAAPYFLDSTPEAASWCEHPTELGRAGPEGALGRLQLSAWPAWLSSPSVTKVAGTPVATLVEEDLGCVV